MNDPSLKFWNWFVDFAELIPHEEFPESLQNELLSKLQDYDNRLFFLVSTNSSPREFIVTAEGNREAFSVADDLVAAAPDLANWLFISLKPAMGFKFRHTDGPISLNVSELWFFPTASTKDPAKLGIVLGFPDVDFVLNSQSVDTAYTILESAIGERSCINDIAHVSVNNLPEDPGNSGYLELPQLPEYISFHKRQHNGG